MNQVNPLLWLFLVKTERRNNIRDLNITMHAIYLTNMLKMNSNTFVVGTDLVQVGISSLWCLWLEHLLMYHQVAWTYFNLKMITHILHFRRFKFIFINENKPFCIVGRKIYTKLHLKIYKIKNNVPVEIKGHTAEYDMRFLTDSLSLLMYSAYKRNTENIYF